MAYGADERVVEELPAPPKKRSLFKKPTWAKPLEQEEGKEVGIDLFSRAKNLYPIRVAEEQRKRQKKIAKLEHKRSLDSAERKASKSPELKKRRISSQADDHSSDDSPNTGHNEEPLPRRSSTHSTPGSRRSPSSQIKLQASPTTLSGRYSRDLDTEKQEQSRTFPANSGIISLMSDSEDDSFGASAPEVKEPNSANVYDDDDFYISRPIPIPEKEEEEDLMSDEEFPELVQKAREREQKKALERLIAQKSLEEKGYSLNGGSIPLDTVDDLFQGSSTFVADPVVNILITSFIPDTKPMIFKRKISQPFRHPRIAWVDKNIPGPPELKASIFLTWKGKRLFDVGTCSFLGLKAGIDGHLSSTDNTLDEKGRLHLEAWTESLYMEYQRKLQQEEDGEEQAPLAVEQVEKIKLLLKARNMEPIKMKVKPTTPISKLIHYVRDNQPVPEGKEILLYFDGDKLDPDTTVADVELGDMDTVEIHYR